MERTKHNYISLLLLTSGFCLPSVALATEPEICPNIIAMQNIDIQKSDLIEIAAPSTSCCTANGFPYTIDGEWGVKEYINSYGTKDTWALRLHNVRANNPEDAFLKMRNSLPTLSLAYGPLRYMGRWSCGYYSTEGNALANLL